MRGAARAITVELALAGAVEINVANRSAERGRVLVDLLNNKTPAKATFHPWRGPFAIPEGTDILVNAMPAEYRKKALSIDGVENALVKARQIAGGNDLICVAGSLYLIGAARSILLGEIVR